MKKPHRCILLAFIVWVNLKESFSLPVPEDELDTSTRLLGSRSVATSFLFYFLQPDAFIILVHVCKSSFEYIYSGQS